MKNGNEKRLFRDKHARGYLLPALCICGIVILITAYVSAMRPKAGPPATPTPSASPTATPAPASPSPIGPTGSVTGTVYVGPMCPTTCRTQPSRAGYVVTFTPANGAPEIKAVTDADGAFSAQLPVGTYLAELSDADKYVDGTRDTTRGIVLATWKHLSPETLTIGKGQVVTLDISADTRIR